MATDFKTIYMWLAYQPYVEKKTIVMVQGKPQAHAEPKLYDFR